MYGFFGWFWGVEVPGLRCPFRVLGSNLKLFSGFRVKGLGLRV